MENYNFNKQYVNNFAILSGDFNPIHIDPIYARRTLFSRPIVHGVCVLLTGIEVVPLSYIGKLSLKRIKATFNKYVEVGETVSFKIEKSDDKLLRVKGYDKNNSIVVSISCYFDDAFFQDDQQVENCNFKSSKPIELTSEEITNTSGTLKVGVDKKLLNKIMPKIADKMNLMQISHILATTRIVGMHCPGLHSIYSMIELSFNNECNKNLSLSYSVSEYRKALNFVQISVSSEISTGTLSTFLRPEHVAQPTFEAVKLCVKKNEFEDQKALVIGGSRGLGEVACKILAAGGADVVFTYYQGSEDAERVLSEIYTGKKKHKAFNLDASSSISHMDIQVEEGFHPTHLYFFATPPVTSQLNRGFDLVLFNRLCTVYISGLSQIIDVLYNKGCRELIVLAPSSVYVTDVPKKMGEYSAAKSAMESAMKSISQQFQNLTIMTPRMPMMMTDLSTSIDGGGDFVDAVQTLKTIISELS